MDLTGKVALVTGAGRGLGWGVARAMARAGARVCVSDINDDDIGRAVRTIEDDGGEALGRHLDTASGDAFEALVAELVERWGRIDTLVHCAIYMPLLTFDATTPESWRRQLAVGLDGLFYGTHAVWPHMKRQGGGHVIGVASGSSLRGYHEEIAYCAIKHGQEGFVKALALEAQGHGVAVNTMGPGKPVKPTRLSWEELEATPESVKAGWADPAELGRAFAWLAAQPPTSFNGLRFDAGPIVDTLDREGDGFDFAVEKVTLYPDDFRERQRWLRDYPG